MNKDDEARAIKKAEKLKEKEFKERLLILSDLNIGVIENEYTW